jgi:hypothetical protein
MVYPALLPLMRKPQLPVVEWTDAPAGLNGLVRFAERRNLVSAPMPSHFKRSLPTSSFYFHYHRAYSFYLICTLIAFNWSQDLRSVRRPVTPRPQPLNYVHAQRTVICRKGTVKSEFSNFKVQRSLITKVFPTVLITYKMRRGWRNRVIE